MIIPRVNQITPSNQVEYWITLPYGGNLLANIQKGRKEMLSKFKVKFISHKGIIMEGMFGH